MILREETAADHDAAREVQRAAFGGAKGDVVARLLDALRRDDPKWTGVVAEDGGEVIGHVLFTTSLLDAPSRLVDVRVLSPIAVAPDRQRQGVGKRLIEYGLALLEERGVPLVFLEGDPAYYSRRGFSPGGDHGFRKPSLRLPDVAFQVVKLSAYEEWMTGTLVYLHTFWDLDCVGLR
ncbi:N-acetyltransferase [Actinoplanes sp. NPDC089786]|uniref:GNAT family N-acetyltransferase n=1 Tax=Actinoplanes sp. NPDC089786 TaxID=3155185 RepID=UPI00342B9A32